MSGNALYFDGVDDYIDFIGGSSLLAQDFTASFYFAPENSFGLVDIISRREACAPDSAVAVRYEPNTGLLRAELTEGINERAVSEGRLPNDRCWFHIVWVRAGTRLFLFINGLLVDDSPICPNLDARNNGVLGIANSPCLSS